MAFCANCGSRLVEGANFCTSCGAHTGRKSAPTYQKSITSIFSIPNPFEGVRGVFDRAQQQCQERSEMLNAPYNDYVDAESDCKDEHENMQKNSFEMERETQATGDSKQHKVNEGFVTKCPACGELINELIAVCPACGTYISRNEANYSVEQFKNELMRIEKERKTVDEIHSEMLSKAKTPKQIQAVKKAIESRNQNEFYNFYVSGGNSGAVDRKKLTLIRDYPIPNDVEEISEFMLLALSNINVNLSKNTWVNKLNHVTEIYDYMLPKAISDAWVAKMEQMYNKAKLSFGNDPMFRTIEEMYTNKMIELKRIKREK